MTTTTAIPSGDAFADARRGDPRGDVVHLAAAALWAAMLAFATAPKDIALAVLVVVAIIRLRHTAATYVSLRGDRVLGLLLVAMGWTAVTLLWSPDRAQGLRELRAFRSIVAWWALWPVLDRTPWIVGGFLLGAAGQHVVQLLQGLDVLERMPKDRGRLRGLLHPIHTATVCTTALGWHAALMLHGRRTATALGALGAAAALAGLVATGSRGPWIGAVVAVAVWIAVVARRRPASRRALAAVTAVLLIGAGAALPVTWRWIGPRVEQATADLRTARTGDLDTNLGVRIASGRAALWMTAEAPIGGTGAGGFEAAALERPEAPLLRDSRHAHSTWLHVAATTGLVGLVLWLVAVALALGRAARDRLDHPFADGALFGLVAWLVAASFDAAHISGQMLGILVLLLVLAGRKRPEVGGRGIRYG